MNTHFLNTIFLSLFNQSLQMVDVRVHVSIRKQSEEMHLSILTVIYKSAPGFCFKDFTCFDIFIYQLRSLRINLSAAKCIVSYLAVPHIIIRRKSNSKTMCLDFCMRAVFPQVV